MDYLLALVEVVSFVWSSEFASEKVDVSSADTRTDKPLMLGHSLLQHQHIGILPTSDESPDVLPLQDPSSITTMPEAWVR